MKKLKILVIVLVWPGTFATGFMIAHHTNTKTKVTEVIDLPIPIPETPDIDEQITTESKESEEQSNNVQPENDATLQLNNVNTRTFQRFAYRELYPKLTSLKLSDKAMTISIENSANGKRVFRIKTEDTNVPISQDVSFMFDKLIESNGDHRYSSETFSVSIEGEKFQAKYYTYTTETNSLSDFVTKGIQGESVLKVDNTIFLDVKHGDYEKLIQIVPLNQSQLPTNIESFGTRRKIFIKNYMDYKNY